MQVSTDIKSITYLKSHTADLFEQINNSHSPVVITQNGEARAVIQDPKTYDDMRKAFGLLKIISQGEADIRAGRVKTQQEVFDRIEKMLKEKENAQKK